MALTTSSITDKPIATSIDDLLKVQKYSQALSNFILSSDTPITIGLQGEWGTGKTSLMSLLVEDFNKRNIATSWVNTWEYSMFQGVNETTPRVLQGMLEKLKDSCKRRGLWSLKDDKKETFKKAAKFLGGLANQIVANQTGLDMAGAADGINDNSGKTAVEIAEIKSMITDLINDLITDDANPVTKVVFFVDDLDRIPPSDAVEVLEALKNIFDIPHCVFILAIDYDVVVKGLEGKFGHKTEENEREFRSFFDKIIQVPFSMPIGTYDIENFLVEKLKSIGINIQEDEKELYAKTVRYTIGFNPRSLKRYLNSFSLINHLRELQSDGNENLEERDDFMLFSILGIQISYPKIFRLLSQSPNFTKWDKGFANKFGIEWDDIQEKLSKFGESELLDEEWEQVVWGACQKDPYLKSRAFSLLELFNLLRESFKGSLDEELEYAMTFAAITNVDDDAETKQATQKVGKKILFVGLDSKIHQLKEENYENEAIFNFVELWSPLYDILKTDPKYRINFARSGSSFNDDSKYGRGNKQLIYCDNPSKKTLGVKCAIKKNSQCVNKLKEELFIKYNLQDSENIYVSKDGDLILEASLKLELKNLYQEFLNFVAISLIKYI
jgi:hypothetical protein